MANVRTKPIHQACFRNLQRLLKGKISFAEWRRHHDELESRLSPEPELPFTRTESEGLCSRIA